MTSIALIKPTDILIIIVCKNISINFVVGSIVSNDFRKSAISISEKLWDHLLSMVYQTKNNHQTNKHTIELKTSSSFIEVFLK